MTDDFHFQIYIYGFPSGSDGKESIFNAGSEVKVKIIQLCPTLCKPMDCIYGILQDRILEWVDFPSPGDLPNPGIKPRSPVLQADSLPAEPKGSPRIPECVAYPFSSRSSLPRNRTGVSCIAGGFFTNWAMCVNAGRPRFNPWVRKFPWRREWLPTPVFLPGEFHG